MRASKLEQVRNAPTTGHRIAEAYLPDGVRIEVARPGARLADRAGTARGSFRASGARPGRCSSLTKPRSGSGASREWRIPGSNLAIPLLMRDSSVQAIRGER